MTRLVRDGAAEIYQAAHGFVQAVLLRDGSIFSPGREIWTEANCDDLYSRILKHPDVTKDSFENKLERQLSGASNAVVQLAAEALYFHLLLTRNVGRDAKISLLNRVLSWMPETVVIPTDVQSALATGLVGPGRAFNTYRANMIGFLLKFVREWKRQSPDVRKQALKDAWYFRDIVFGVTATSAFTQQEALLHLVFPDVFESVVSRADKKRIVAAFADHVDDPSLDVDRKLAEIRLRLSDNYGSGFHFYDKTIMSQWYDQSVKEADDTAQPTSELGPYWWVNQGSTYKQEQQGGYLWAPQRTKGGRTLTHHTNLKLLRSGDVVFHYAQGAIRAVSQVIETAKPAPRPSELPTTSWVDEGNLVVTEYVPMDNVISLSTIPETERAPKAGPFDRTGGVKEGYIYPLSPNFVSRLVQRHLDGFPDFVLEKVGPPDWVSSIARLADSLLLERTYLEKVERLVKDKGQVILYGPPGTGKTYVAQKLAECFAGSEERVTVVQFHPSYSYEDFVEGYRPRTATSGDGVGFVLREGPIKRIASEARKKPDTVHILLIDEINRGNIPKVFGELYCLLEYRNTAMKLQYSDRDFSLPPNLWIIGTMNTADRSIALIDAALRRRFFFVPFFPDRPPIQGLLRRWLKRHKPEMLWVADVVDRANELLGERHAAIGPSYFLKTDLNDEWVDLIWEHSILPYLAEQFYGEEERLAKFTLESLGGFGWSAESSDGNMG